LDKETIKQLSDKIKKKAIAIGFHACGISAAGALPENEKHFRNWLDLGLHAGMGYMENHFEKRVDPTLLLDGAKSVISVLFNYFPAKELEKEENYQISKYAYGTDYHFVMKDKLKALIEYINDKVDGINARAFVDSAPVLDRAWAAKAGLGWIGKNTNLITKEQGSYFFIGEIITDLELEYADAEVPNHCGGCTRCIDACPTNALKPYQLDSNKCISYLTIENKDKEISPEFEGQLNDWIFGCDICQDVCPWNRLSEPHTEPAFLPSSDLLDMRKEDWESLEKSQFKKMFKNSAINRTRFEGLKRNIGFFEKD
jgi:epoxyqueuosine reductase